QLVYAGAGHPPPILLGSGSHAISPITVSSSPPIGAGMRTGARQTVVSVPGRGTVCFYTDGVTEARVGADLFRPEPLRQTVAGLQVGDSAAVLLNRVAEQTDARPDRKSTRLNSSHRTISYAVFCLKKKKKRKKK